MRHRSIVLSAVLAVSLAGSVFAADKYTLDKDHSSVGFAVKHLVISTTKGQFKDYALDLVYDAKDVTKSSVKVVIQVASIDTANANRDNHLRSGDFFEAEKFPTITFSSRKVEKKADGYVLTGPLTIKGVTKEVSIPFVLNGPLTDPWGNVRLGAEGTLTINRQDYGVSWNKTLDGGGVVVGDEVKIELVVEAVKAK
jgi:polyisoprenoid-binding protein YceI